VAAVFVFDTAPRLALREANRTGLERAADLARVLLAKLPPSSKVATLDTGGGVAAFAPLLAAVAARIDRLAVGTPAITLRGAIDEGLRLLETSPLARKELYVFTDCSHGAWDNAAPQPEPGAAPFVTPGSKVGPETTVGLVEAMKMFNAVHAGTTGTIAEVCVQDATIVEYGQVLFRVRPS
jgi:multidrug efflux pump subunit AcrA (membrane-fusion protein)